MGRKASDGSAGARLVALAERQHGVFSIAQAIEAGVSERQVRRGLARHLHGYRVMRLTWRDLTRRPRLVADRVRRALVRSASH